MSTEILIILALVILNGVLAMAEMAVVSARESRLEQSAQDGSRGAAEALALARNPNRFLSTVQIGITSIGILSGAFGGATIAEKIAAELHKVAFLAPHSHWLAVAIVVVLITFLSLVLGELVPKRLALDHAESLAMAVAPAMHALATAATPIVLLLSASTDFVLRIFGVRPSAEPEVTHDDIMSMLDQGTEEGVFEEGEQDMVQRILRLGDRGVSTLMTPRTDMVYIDVDATYEQILRKITTHPFSRFPVKQHSPDDVIGYVQARDLLLQRVDGPIFDIRKALQPVLFIPEATSALDALERLKKSVADMAVVIDEYGGVLGLVSMNDILEAIVGDVASSEGESEPEVILREDGSWLLDGMILMDDLKDALGIDELPDEDEGRYDTLSGLMMAQLGRVPVSGDHFTWGGLRFEVVDMDGRRVDKVMVSREPPGGKAG
jgi:putative hemolysin